MQNEFIALRRIACDENVPSGGRELGAGDLRQKVVGAVRGQTQSIRVINSQPQEEEKPLSARHLAERAEAQLQRQAEQERECLRTQQMKNTLEEVVNASKERFNAAHGPRRSNSDQLRAVELEFGLDKNHMESRAQVGCVRAIAVATSASSSKLADATQQACSRDAIHQDSRGLAAQNPDIGSMSLRGGLCAAAVAAAEMVRAPSASTISNSPLPPASWAATSVIPPPRTRPGLQRDKGGGIGRLGVGGNSTGRLEVTKTADRSVSPSSRAVPSDIQSRAAERRSESLERRNAGRSVSPGARQGGRASYLADTTASAQKRTGSHSKSRPNSAGPRLSDRREVSAPSLTSSALKSRPPMSNTPRGMKGGGSRSGSTGTLHTVMPSASGSLQAPAVTRQKSAGSSSSSTSIAKTPRGALAGTSAGARVADSNRPSLASSRSSDGSLGMAGLASSSSRGCAQEPPSPRNLRRSGALTARPSGTNTSGPQRKRQSCGNLEASPGSGINSSGTSSPGTSSPPRSAQSWGGWSGTAPSCRRSGQTTSPTVRPPQVPSTADQSGHRGGAVLSESNCSERLCQAGEAPEPLIACPEKVISESPRRQEESRSARPGIRDRGLSELGAAVVASVRLPAEKERLREVGLKSCFETRCTAAPNDRESAEPSDAPLEAEKSRRELNPASIHNEAKAILAAPSCENVLQEPPASLLTSLSPLSPIREVAEGGATPKALDSREVMEVQVQEARELQGRAATTQIAEPKRQLDLEEQPVESHEDPAAESDSLAQLASSKERYLQIRDRFLAK